MSSEHAAAAEFVIKRVFDAPPQIVWKAWTEPDRLAQWWGPKGFTMRAMKLELKPGGMFHYAMQSAAGQTMWGKYVYREIEPPSRLVFVNSFSDEHAATVRAPFSESWPLEIFNTLTLTAEGSKTRLMLVSSPLNASEDEVRTFEGMFTSMQQGFGGTFDQLDVYLANLAGN